MLHCYVLHFSYLSTLNPIKMNSLCQSYPTFTKAKGCSTR